MQAPFLKPLWTPERTEKEDTLDSHDRLFTARYNDLVRELREGAAPAETVRSVEDTAD